MAEVITIGGHQYKKRNPWGAWLLCFTIVYIFIWYYKINQELRQYTGEDNRPGLRTWGIIVPLLNFVIHYRTADQTARAEQKAGLGQTIEPFLAVVASVIYFLMVPYIQIHLNKVWDAEVGKSVGGSGPAASPTVPPPPFDAPPPPPVAGP